MDNSVWHEASDLEQETLLAENEHFAINLEEKQLEESPDGNGHIKRVQFSVFKQWVASKHDEQKQFDKLSGTDHKYYY